VFLFHPVNRINHRIASSGEVGEGTGDQLAQLLITYFRNLIFRGDRMREEGNKEQYLYRLPLQFFHPIWRVALPLTPSLPSLPVPFQAPFLEQG
jgi:hypothetical protein